MRDLSELIGVEALSETDRRYLVFAEAFNSVLVNQGPEESRPLEETLARAWKVAGELPPQELTMVSAADLAAYYPGGEGGGGGA